MTQLILPGHPDFTPTLEAAPFFWQEIQRDKCQTISYVVDSESGILRPVKEDDLEEYMLGGELEEVIDQQEDDEEFELFFNQIKAEMEQLKCQTSAY